MTQAIENAVIVTQDQNGLELINNLMGNGTKFVSFTYLSKGENLYSRYTLQIVDFRKVYNDDLLTLELMDKSKFNDIQKEVFDNIVKSIQESLAVGLGNNSDYTRKDTDYKVGIFTLTSKGLNVKALLHSKSDKDLPEFMIEHNKEQKEKAKSKKPVNSSLKTIYKKEIEKELKRSKIREFCLDFVKIAKLNGETLEFE